MSTIGLGVLMFTVVILSLVGVVLFAKRRLVQSGDATISINDNPDLSMKVQTGGTLLNALADQVTARLDNIYSMSGQLRGDPLVGLCIESGAQQSLQGTVTADVSGTSFLPAIVIPIPLIARTQAKACKGLADQLKLFIVSDEIV